MIDFDKPSTFNLSIGAPAFNISPGIEKRSLEMKLAAEIPPKENNLTLLAPDGIPATTPSFRSVSAEAGEIDWEKIAIDFKLDGKGLV